MGADCILLIAACLDDAQMQSLEALAMSLDSMLKEIQYLQQDKKSKMLQLLHLI
jgi:indole-3-glycerol phosphate synthase